MFSHPPVYIEALETPLIETVDCFVLMPHLWSDSRNSIVKVRVISVLVLHVSARIFIASSIVIVIRGDRLSRWTTEHYRYAFKRSTANPTFVEKVVSLSLPQW